MNMFEDANKFICECGQACNPVSPEWRCAGSYWEHYHGYPIGHVAVFKEHANQKSQNGADLFVNGEWIGMIESIKTISQITHDDGTRTVFFQQVQIKVNKDHRALIQEARGQEFVWKD